MNETLFFDTYAIIEIIKGNANYDKYKECGKITSMLNLLELYYALLKDYGEKTAAEYFDIFLPFIIPYNEETIKHAAKFRFKNIKNKFSYIDSLGYIIALENSVKFLTGDPHFEGMPNVEFVR
jgi:predicted nucleic acid-binding protein